MSDDITTLGGMLSPEPSAPPATFDTGTVTSVTDSTHIRVNLGDKTVTTFVPVSQAGTAAVDSAVRVSVQENTYVLDSVLGAAGAGPVPVGSIVMWMTATIPTGWLKLDGSSYSSATYPSLFDVLGTTTLPDMRDRFPIGTSGTKAVTTTGGSATVTMTEAQMPVHDHTMAHTHEHPHTHTITHTHTMAHTHEHDHNHNINHTHSVPGRSGADINDHDKAGTASWGDTNTVSDITTSTPSTTVSGAPSDATTGGSSAANTGASSAASSGAASDDTTGASSATNTGNAGSGSAMTVLNPYLSLNFIIKAS